MVQTVHQEQQAHQDQLVHQAQQAQQETRDQQVHRVHRVSKARKAYKAHKEYKVRKEYKVHKAIQRVYALPIPFGSTFHQQLRLPLPKHPTGSFFIGLILTSTAVPRSPILATEQHLGLEMAGGRGPIRRTTKTWSSTTLYKRRLFQEMQQPVSL